MHKNQMRKLKIFFVPLMLFVLCNCAVRHRPAYEKDGKTYCRTNGIFRSQWDDYYEQALSCMEGEFYQDALFALDEALKQAPDEERLKRTYGMHFINYFPHREKGVVYYWTGEYEKARSELERSIKDEPSAKAFYYLDKVRTIIMQHEKLPVSTPMLTVQFPSARFEEPDEIWTKDDPVLISGIAEDEQYVSKILLADRPILIEGSKKRVEFKEKIRLGQGEHDIEIMAQNLLDGSIKQKVTIHVDRSGPIIILKAFDSDIGVQGYLYDDSGEISLTVNGKSVSIPEGKEVSFTAPVDPEPESVTFLATDRLGNQTKTIVSQRMITQNQCSPLFTHNMQNTMTDKKTLEIPSSFNPVGSGARAIGRGGAFIAIAEDATAASWNPEGFAQLDMPECSIVSSNFYRKSDHNMQNTKADLLRTLEITSSINPVGSGARAIGRGGAFIAIAEDATAASWNPGGLIQLKRAPELSFAYNFYHKEAAHNIQNTIADRGTDIIMPSSYRIGGASWNPGGLSLLEYQENSVLPASESQKPEIVLKGWSDYETVFFESVSIEGEVIAQNNIEELTINDISILKQRGSLVAFNLFLDLKKGKNTVIIKATDELGNTSLKHINIIRKIPEVFQLKHRLKIAVHPFNDFEESGIFKPFHDNRQKQGSYFAEMINDASFNDFEESRVRVIIQHFHDIRSNQGLFQPHFAKMINDICSDVQSINMKKAQNTHKAMGESDNLSAQDISEHPMIAIHPANYFVKQDSFDGRSNYEYFLSSFVKSFADQGRFQLLLRNELKHIIVKNKINHESIKTTFSNQSDSPPLFTLLGTYVETKYGIEITLRLVENKTSQIVIIKDVYSDFKSRKSLKNMANELAEKICKESPLLSGIITQITDTELIAEFEEKEKIKVGWPLIIYRKNELRRNPVTGSLLGSDTEIIGYSHVMESMEGRIKAELVDDQKNEIRIGDFMITQ